MPKKSPAEKPDHPSFTRLLQFAREITARKPGAVATPTDLAVALQVSPQTVNNWRRRGVSKEGALAAQGEFGCSAHWILTDEGNRAAAMVPAPPPPAPPRDFSDRHVVTESEWDTLQAVQVMLGEERISDIRRQYAEANKRIRDGLEGQILTKKKES